MTKAVTSRSRQRPGHAGRFALLARRRAGVVPHSEEYSIAFPDQIMFHVNGVGFLSEVGTATIGGERPTR